MKSVKINIHCFVVDVIAFVWATGFDRVDDSHARVLVSLQKYDLAALRNLSGLANQVAAYAQSIDLGSTFSPVASIFNENPCAFDPMPEEMADLRDVNTRRTSRCDPTTAPDPALRYYILFEPSGN